MILKKVEIYAQHVYFVLIYFIERTFANKRPPSLVEHQVLTDTALLQVLEKDLDQHKPVHEHVMQKGEEVLKTMKPGGEKEKLEQKLKDLDRRWNELSDKINKRSTKLLEVEPSASKYVHCSEPFTNWLSESEDKLKDCEKIPEDEESAAQQLELLEVGFMRNV